MRFMVIIKADANAEAGVRPDTGLLAAVGKLNEEMMKAGVLLAGEGLQPSAKGARIQFSGARRTVIDGPFRELKELISGFMLIRTASKQEAIGWASRIPFESGEVEVRQVSEAEDFGSEFTPELREKEERLRGQLAHEEEK